MKVLFLPTTLGPITALQTQDPLFFPLVRQGVSLGRGGEDGCRGKMVTGCECAVTRGPVLGGVIQGRSSDPVLPADSGQRGQEGSVLVFSDSAAP